MTPLLAMSFLKAEPTRRAQNETDVMMRSNRAAGRDGQIKTTCVGQISAQPPDAALISRYWLDIRDDESITPLKLEQVRLIATLARPHEYRRVPVRLALPPRLPSRFRAH
jgi:hypothetical protein